MKAFLLAAGHGTRLKPLTNSIPKCLIPIHEQPLLGIWLELCLSHGINEILINTHAHSSAVVEFVRGRSRDLKVHISEEPILLGSAGTLSANRKWIANEEEFWILYADVLTNANLSLMQAFHRQQQQSATIGIYRVSNPEQCGIVSLDGSGVVTGFEEKPEKPKGNLAFSGLMMATPAILECVPSESPADIGFHVLPRLVGRMAAYLIQDYLLDIGNPAKYALAQKEWPGLNSQSRTDVTARRYQI
jgi:mannose-1-phosphate guanylyltransferase